jgi:protein-disulfide isomerase
VVLVQFSDFQCPFCKEEAKILRQNLLTAYPKQVRLYFKDFPLEQIHPWAMAAAIAGRCVFRQNPATFWEFYDWMFEHQQEITAENLRAKVVEYGQQKSLDVLQLGRCIDTRATAAEVERNLAEGRALGLNSIPALFVNGRRIVGQVAWANLKQIIDFEIEYQTTAQNAGEAACCELPPLSPAPRVGP